MSADPQSVLARLAELQVEITCPETGRPPTTYGTAPYTVAVSSMPLFINTVGPLVSMVHMGSDHQAREFVEVRNYFMSLYHSAFGTGVEGEKLTLLTPYYDLVYAKFMSYPHLKQLGGVIDSKIISDSGTGTLPFSGVSYFSIKFTLQVQARVRRTLEELE